MTVKIAHLVLAGWLLTMAAAPSAKADQHDPKLDGLFQRLKLKELPVSDAQALEDQIWRIWHASGSPSTDLLLARVETMLAADALESAIKLLDEIIAISPDFAEGWNKRATVYFLRNDFPAAMRDAEHALRLEPRHFGAWAGLGAIFLELGQDAKALLAYQEALKINPHLTDIAKEAERLTLSARGRSI
jgi:tetratricopeptide (TPR) repeat protein